MGDVPELDIEFIDSTELAGRPRRAGDDGRGPGDRQRDLHRRRRAAARPADPPGGGASRSHRENLTMRRVEAAGTRFNYLARKIGARRAERTGVPSKESMCVDETRHATH